MDDNFAYRSFFILLLDFFKDIVLFPGLHKWQKHSNIIITKLLNRVLLPGYIHKKGVFLYE